jgi:hypothetical protein
VTYSREEVELGREVLLREGDPTALVLAPPGAGEDLDHGAPLAESGRTSLPALEDSVPEGSLSLRAGPAHDGAPRTLAGSGRMGRRAGGAASAPPSGLHHSRSDSSLLAPRAAGAGAGSALAGTGSTAVVTVPARSGHGQGPSAGHRGHVGLTRRHRAGRDTGSEDPWDADVSSVTGSGGEGGVLATWARTSTVWGEGGYPEGLGPDSFGATGTGTFTSAGPPMFVDASALAATTGQAAFMARLNLFQFPLDVETWDGWTPLTRAALFGDPNLTRALLLRGANPNVETRLKHTPLTCVPRVPASGLSRP